MGRNRSVAGKSYKVDYRSSSDVLVTFTYRCPYCGEETMVQKEYQTNLEVLEKGVFYEPLAYGKCGEVADVRYLPHKRVW